MDIFIDGEDRMLAFGRRLAELCPPGCVLFLEGELGAGKTTVVRGFLRACGHEGAVKSPTYTLVEPYLFENKQVYHFDLYRLGDAEELEYMGIREYFEGGAICLVEWAHKGAGYLPRPDLTVAIRYADAGGRNLRLDAGTSHGQRLLKELGAEWSV